MKLSSFYVNFSLDLGTDGQKYKDMFLGVEDSKDLPQVQETLHYHRIVDGLRLLQVLLDGHMTSLTQLTVQIYR